ncbi:hypothetical protein EK21DRAFT_115948 [Setomelanomma holmii]|uniref:WW domain-containing protein n=1 Tax=Setomelanomma holmii TaxID=210430 RepID=A0A9P4LIJ8_9PLEO|nr:hypothetical protein EK21DRAFT_115948 [Setomelanomma holmii]
MPTLQDAVLSLQHIINGDNITGAAAYAFWDRTTLMGRYGRFFVTGGGLLGYGPHNLWPREIVCLLLGHQAPVLLRASKNDDRHSRHQVVGAAYVHGLMDAEALLGPVKPPWQKVIRHLSGHDCRIFNANTGEETWNDPRSGPLPEEWEEIERITRV